MRKKIFLAFFFTSVSKKCRKWPETSRYAHLDKAGPTCTSHPNPNLPMERLWRRWTWFLDGLVNEKKEELARWLGSSHDVKQLSFKQKKPQHFPTFLFLPICFRFSISWCFISFSFDLFCHQAYKTQCHQGNIFFHVLSAIFPTLHRQRDSQHAPGTLTEFLTFHAQKSMSKLNELCVWNFSREGKLNPIYKLEIWPKKAKVLRCLRRHQGGNTSMRGGNGVKSVGGNK